MYSKIVSGTLAYLASTPGSPAQLVELHLTRYFTVVELSDGSVGACMSYYDLPDTTLMEAERRIADSLRSRQLGECAADALDLEVAGIVANARQRFLLVSAVTAAVASALSAATIRAGGDEVFVASAKRPSGLMHGIDSALIVGLGGHLLTLAKDPSVSRIHVVDLVYEERGPELDAFLAGYASRFPGKRFSISTRLRPEEYKNFGLIVATGSTLSNGTLDDILACAAGGARIVLQGQSAGLHPKLLFENGVRLVITTVKPADVSRRARGDYDGQGLQPLLNGGLPWIYLSPRSSQASIAA
jgi:hypothetical protein